MRSKHLVGLVLVATLMATFVPLSTMVYAQNQEKKAEKFIEMAERAQAKVDELKALIEGNGIEIDPEITALYNEGISKLAEVETDSSLAFELAREAMKIFRKVYGQLNTLLEEAQAETETAEEVETLMEAIERARERIEKVRDIIETNDEYLTDYAEGVLNDLLDEAEDLLDVAEDALLAEPRDVSIAAKNLGDANKLISQAFVSLKKHVSGALNSRRIKGFLNVIEKFYSRVVRLVEREGLTKFDVELETIARLIKDAKDSETAFNDAIANLIEARLRLETILNEIKELRNGGPKGG